MEAHEVNLTHWLISTQVWIDDWSDLRTLDLEGTEDLEARARAVDETLPAPPYRIDFKDLNMFEICAPRS